MAQNQLEQADARCLVARTDLVQRCRLWLEEADHRGLWFGIIERQALHRADVASIPVLNAQIRAFVAAWNDHCHPFVWTKTSTEILKKVDRSTTSKTGH